MERKNKYTHLIERVAGLPKALAADLLKRQTGLPLAQNYWRTERRQGPAEHLRPDLAGHVVKAHLRYPTLYRIARGAAEPHHGRYTC